MSNKEKFNQTIDRKSKQAKQDQFAEAGVLIEEMKRIDTDKAYLKVQARINKNNSFSQVYRTFSRIAAILFIPLVLVTIWSLKENVGFESERISLQEISNPAGVRSRVVLPDGSTVWLNADSKISYSIPFVGENREIQLVGEAFLDVAKNPKVPFDVKFGEFNVRVLGTQFNVRAFPEEELMEVVLKEGSIRLSNETGVSSKGAVTLEPDQQWTYNLKSRKASLSQTDADRYIAWHQNVLILNDTPLKEAAALIERWYGITVRIMDEKLYSYKFTTVFNNEPLNVVLDLLELSSPIQIEYVPSKINKTTGVADKPIIKINSR